MILDLTAMVDVVFLMMIFFMTTAEFARTTRADVVLANEKGEQKEEAEEAGLIVNLLRDGSIVINEEQLTLDEMESVVKEQIRAQPDGPTQFKLTIRADRNADSASLNAMLRVFERLGIGGAKLATEVPGG
jgi:biopolymer transport protein ExbD